MSAKSIALFESHLRERNTTLPSAPPATDPAEDLRAKSRHWLGRHRAWAKASETALQRALEYQAMADLIASGSEKLR